MGSRKKYKVVVFLDSMKERLFNAIVGVLVGVFATNSINLVPAWEGIVNLLFAIMGIVLLIVYNSRR